MKESDVFVFLIQDYNLSDIYPLLPEEVFSQILPGNKVVLKPNWIRESHLSRQEEWEQVITHPDVITAVLRKIIEKLEGNGKVSVIDGPETASSFEKILSRYPVSLWKKMAKESTVEFEILDLRDDEWVDNGSVIVARNKLPGDPLGSTEVNLQKDYSEFYLHQPPRGYYGADSDISETNRAHDGINNLYRVSRTALEADVFVNLPKLKTHKKAGITSNLKNLVGINTYKNFLPHNSIGTVEAGGDQFPDGNSKSSIESTLMPFLHQYILKYPFMAKLFSPMIVLGKKIFGDNTITIRGGSWYGNDTMWRTILDLNKILLYANPEGTLRKEGIKQRKKYISVVDAIIAGEGNGPKSPDPVNMGYLFCGTNPVAVDSVNAIFMGFDPLKIPSISRAFNINRYPLCEFRMDEINVNIENESFKATSVPQKWIRKIKPHFGWTGHIEFPQI